MDKQITIPNVDIVEQAKKIGSEDADDLAVMQYIALASIASQAVRVRKYFDDRESQGWVQNFDNILVTGAQPSQEFRLDFPAQSISITNDGVVPFNALAVVWVEINKRFHTRRTLRPRETLNINFETHKLKRFFVQCPAGFAPTIRVTAKG